jgi:hypothetical protein
MKRADRVLGSLDLFLWSCLGSLCYNTTPLDKDINLSDPCSVKRKEA